MYVYVYVYVYMYMTLYDILQKFLANTHIMFVAVVDSTERLPDNFLYNSWLQSV